MNETSGGLFEYCLSHLQKEGAICTINQAQNNLARLQPLHAVRYKLEETANVVKVHRYGGPVTVSKILGGRLQMLEEC